MRFINKITQIIFLCFCFISLKLKEVIFAKKTLVFVSKSKIKRVEISSIGNVVIISFLLFVCSLFVQSVTYHSIIANKSTENQNLHRINNALTKEIYKIDKNIKHIENYFMANSFYGKLSKNYKGAQEDKEINEIKHIIKDIIPEGYKDNFIKISRSKSILETIEDISRQRIENLSKILSLTKLRLFNNIAFDSEDEEKAKEISLNINEQLIKNQGGPFFYHQDIESGENKALFSNEGQNYIQILSNLEKFVMHAPLSVPMNEYYISSGFGKRKDPFTGKKSQHKGTDFAGKRGEKITSPSFGVVKLARRFGAYGNTIIISHGYGIETLFGHLKKINVKKGQIVKRGDVIGVQGSTGRSTGDHLHYEIRYNKKPLNPIGFVRAGNEIKQYYQQNLK
jgi:murein DD-endopeptidase MepM/ murein hydrolase activator NlpD